MRLRVVLVVSSTLLTCLGGCSSDDSPAAANPTATTGATTAGSAAAAAAAAANDGAVPTVCQAEQADDRPTVTIDVDDASDGFGRFGLKTPSPLPAGTIRLMVNAVDDNPNPVSVTVGSAGATVFQFVQVESGVLCSADLELAAGDYSVTFGDKTKTFTVDPQT